MAVDAPRARRRRPRLSELKGVLTTLREAGMEPTALDSLPDGTFRWHFTQPPTNDEDALDRELEGFNAKHGYDRA